MRYIIQGVSRPNTQWQLFTVLDVYSEFQVGASPPLECITLPCSVSLPTYPSAWCPPLCQHLSRPNTTSTPVFTLQEHTLSIRLWPPWDDPQNRIYREGSAINLLVEDSAIERSERGAFVTLGKDTEGTWWPGLIVVHPDHLASATRVADSHGREGCARRAFLTVCITGNHGSAAAAAPAVICAARG